MTDHWNTEKGLLPNVIKHLSASRTRPLALIVNPAGAIEEVSAADLHNAANRAAWFIKQAIPEEEQKFYFMGASDIVYLVWVLGAMKTGKVVVCPSPANTVAANQLLFQDVGAKKMFYSAEDFDTLLTPLHTATKGSLEWIMVPSHDALLSRTIVKEYPFTDTFDEICGKPFLGLHTSGTTGHPKPLYYTHAITPIYAALNDESLLPADYPHPPVLKEVWEDETCLCTFPLYHAAGYLGAYSSIQNNGTWVLPARGVQLTPENVTLMMQHTRATGLFCPPFILEGMLKSPAGHDFLASGQIKHIGYGGGPMPKHAGDQLAALCSHVMNSMGSTEGGHSPILREDHGSNRWDAIKFLPLGQRMEEVEPGLFELVWPRTELIERTTTFFHTMPHLKTEYRTKDLYEDAGDGWWKYRGRTDNWVAMTNGLKMDPKEMEDTIGAHPMVTSALVAGAGRFRLFLLIELDPVAIPDKSEMDVLEELWPTIDKANQAAPKFGKVPRELVLFAQRAKPFLRSAKGSIQRRLTIAAYEGEIDEMYARTEQGLLTSGLPDIKSISAADIIPFLTELYAQTLECKTICPDEDVFSKGMDSFAISTLAYRLKAALRKAGVVEHKLQSVDVRLMYTGTTIFQMAAKLASTLSLTNGHKPCNGHREDDVLDLLAKYESTVQNAFSKHTVVLTGSTGSLGSYLLATLLARPDVNKVICLNRTADAQDRQAIALRHKGLPPLEGGLDAGRVVFLEASLDRPRLGLARDDYRLLLDETTCIIHNAFPVNFLLSLQSFEPQLRGQHNLLELVHGCTKKPSFLLISSIGAAMRTNSTSKHVPEEIFPRHDAVDLPEQGYSQAKFITERMVDSYAKLTSNRKMAILRVGQVAGPLKGSGAWNIREWLPSLVLSSKFLGAVPATIGQRIDWIPVDTLASIVSEILDDVEQRGASGKGGPKGPTVYNVVNPAVTTWKSLLPAFQNIAPEIVSAEEWICRLEASVDSSKHLLDENPAVKLVDFLKGELQKQGGEMRFVTDNLVNASPTAAGLLPILEEDMRRWMAAWKV